MAQRRRIQDLGTFHREASRRGITYAEAQMEETCEKIGRVRVPTGEDAGGAVYHMVSAWDFLRKKKDR